MSAQSLELKHPYSLLAANPVNEENQRKFIRWFNNYISSSNLNSNKQKLDFINGVISNLLMIKTNIGKAGVGAGAASTKETKDLYNSSIDRLMAIVGREKNRIIKSPDQVPDPPDDLVVILQLNTIQERIKEFQTNQDKQEKFTEMAIEAKKLIQELKAINGTLPSSEGGVYDKKTFGRLKEYIKRLSVSLDAWHRYFIRVVQAPTKEGGRKTRNRRRKRKRKTRKHRQKKRTRRRKPKKRHRKTRRK